MNKLILAFAGEMWCGKWTAVNYLVKKYGWISYKFSQILRDLLDRLYWEQSREKLQKISTIIREEFWEDLLSKAIYFDLKNSDNSFIILDWVRRKSDIEILQTLPYFKLIYIDVDLNTRFDRIKIRWENTDDLTKTFEQFKLEQKCETELQIVWLKKYANYIIDNNWELENLYKTLNDILFSLSS